MKLDPTVNSAELTEVDTFAKPVIVVLPAARVVIPETAPEKVPVVVDSDVRETAPVADETIIGEA
jgi:hypothetical protein